MSKNEKTTTKHCPQCHATIEAEVKKCQHCGSDLRNWFVRHKIVTVVLFVVLYIIGSQSLNEARKKAQISDVPNAQNNSSAATSTEAHADQSTNPVATKSTDDTLKVGQEAYLRLPDNTDATQIICLGSTVDDADKIGKAITANDIEGLMEIRGAFCVGNGTKVKLIEKDFPYRRVRIVQGVNSVDSDKVGKSGWLPMEWVVKN